MWVQDHTNYKEPSSLFEHFIVAGLQPETNLESVEIAFAKRKKWETEMAKSEIIDFKMLHQRRPSVPTLDPQVRCKITLVSKQISLLCNFKFIHVFIGFVDTFQVSSGEKVTNAFQGFSFLLFSGRS